MADRRSRLVAVDQGGSRPAKLSGWSVGFARGDDYDAPETRGIRVAGIVTESPQHRDGRWLRTSEVATVEGRRITTESGSVYELVGDPDPQYLEFLKSTGKTYDPEQPIKVVR